MAFPNTKHCLHEVKNKVEPEHQQLKAWDAPCGPHFLVAPSLHPILRKNRQSTRGLHFKKMRLQLVKKHDKKQQTSTFGLGDIPVPGWIAIIWICLKVQYTLILWISQFPDTPMWTIANTHGNRLILGAGTPSISATPRNSHPTKRIPRKPGRMYSSYS